MLRLMGYWMMSELSLQKKLEIDWEELSLTWLHIFTLWKVVHG
jgi:hypothetical protein